LSFFIVAVLAFWFHWRVIQKEQKNRADGHTLVTRAIYFWGMSLFGLLMVVIAGGFLLNVLLRTWLYPNLDTDTNTKPAMVASQQTSVDSLINCASACGFTAEQVQLANEWKADYAEATTATEVTKTAKRQNDIAMSLPFVLVGIPLFIYHWMTVRRKQSPTDLPPPTGATA
jgi:MFS family permease